MITDADIQELSLPEKLFSYADAYLNASVAICQQMTTNDTSSKWPNAAVALMLAAHAVELFLKGAILAGDPKVNVWARKHHLHELAADYRHHFPGPTFEWHIPFQAEFPWARHGVFLGTDVDRKLSLKPWSVPYYFIPSYYSFILSHPKFLSGLAKQKNRLIGWFFLPPQAACLRTSGSICGQTVRCAIRIS